MTRHSIALGLALLATAASTCFAACSASSGAGFGGPDDGGGSSSGASSGGSSGTSSSGTGTTSGGSSGGSSTSSGGNGASSGTGSGGGTSSGTSSGSDASLDAPLFDAAPPPPYDGGPQVCGVQSNAQPCDLKTHTCCVSQFGMGQCVTHGTSCPSLYAAFSCIAKIDCTTSGDVCCGLANSVSLSASTSCQPVGSGQYCPNAQNPSSTAGGAQLCASQAECTMGQQCIPQHCVGGTNFNLCGLHTESPFSCTQTGSPIP